MSNDPINKVVAVVDLAYYAAISKASKQQLGPEAVATLNGQIQTMIHSVLDAADIPPENRFCKSTGDGAIVVLDTAEQVERFADGLHQAAHDHNLRTEEPVAQRYFRVGACRDPVLLPDPSCTEESVVEVDFAGATLANAARLMNACAAGEILLSEEIWEELPPAMRARYGSKEFVPGKRGELFSIRRRHIIDPPPENFASEQEAALSRPQPLAAFDEVPSGHQDQRNPDLQGPRLTPELREWALQQFTEEELTASLRELREKGGLELHEFIQELEQVLHASESTQ